MLGTVSLTNLGLSVDDAIELDDSDDEGFKEQKTSKPDCFRRITPDAKPRLDNKSSPTRRPVEIFELRISPRASDLLS
jgi:hypothetical protein